MDHEQANWTEIHQEVESLCRLHNEAVANYEKCREFANRMSLLLSKLEDSDCYPLANRAMDILINCDPKVASHCEKANMEKNLLEQMKWETEKKLKECK